MLSYAIPTVGRGPLDKVLEHLSAQTLPGEIFVIANGVKMFPSLPSQTRVISLPQNIGYAGAAQFALQTLSTPYVALINDDAFPPEEFGEACVAYLDRHPDALGVVFPIQNNQDSPLRGIGWNAQWEAVETPDFSGKMVNFTAVILRREAILALGGFCTPYHTYYEDVDLSLRASQKGWQWACLDQKPVKHQPGTSLEVLKDKRFFLLIRNRWWTLLRHFGISWVLTHLIPILYGDLRLLKNLGISSLPIFLKAWSQIPRVPLWPR